MSAWIVSENHITVMVAIVQALVDAGQINVNELPYDGDLSAIGQMLWQENHNSVNYRYEEFDECPVYEWDERKRLPVAEFEKMRLHTPGGMLKVINCFTYQSCETPDWQESDSFKLCDRMRDVLIDLGADDNSKDYNDAPWGVD